MSEEMTRTAELTKDDVMPVVQQAMKFRVVDQATLEQSGDLLTTIRALRGKVTEVFGSATKKAHAAWKAAKANEKLFDDPLKAAEATVKTAIARYRDNLAAEQRRKEEAERKALEAERERLAAEARKDGHEEVAKAIETTEIEKPEPAPQPVVRTPSVQTRQVWYAEVTDMKVLCKAVADGVLPTTLVEPNMRLLNGLARDQKKGLDIPGVVAKPKTVVAGR